MLKVSRPLVFAMLVAPVLFAAPVQAACDHITNAFAYNECLAKQGPQRGQRAISGSAAVDPESTVRGRRQRGELAAGGGNGVVIQRRGARRVSATIDPWSGARRPDATPRGRRRR